MRTTRDPMSELSVSISRRQAAFGVAALTAAAFAPGLGRAAATSLRDAAREMALYGLPLIEIATTPLRTTYMSTPGCPSRMMILLRS